MSRRRNKNLKKILCIFGIIILVIILIIICIVVSRKDIKEEIQTENKEEGLMLYDTKLSEYVKETEDGINLNISPQLNQDKKIDGLTVSNIQLTSINGIATLIADVTNNTDSDTELKSIEAVFFDEEGKELFSAKGLVSSLKVGESTKLNISMSSNCITAYDVIFR